MPNCHSVSPIRRTATKRGVQDSSDGDNVGVALGVARVGYRQKSPIDRMGGAYSGIADTMGSPPGKPAPLPIGRADPSVVRWLLERFTALSGLLIERFELLLEHSVAGGE